MYMYVCAYICMYIYRYQRAPYHRCVVVSTVQLKYVRGCISVRMCVCIFVFVCIYTHATALVPYIVDESSSDLYVYECINVCM